MLNVVPSDERLTLVKFCGLRQAEDIAIVNALRPDFAGFILSPGFRRSVDIKIVRKLCGMLDAGILTVGVFVDEPAARVEEILSGGSIDIVQLHGSEDDGYIRSLRSLDGGNHAVIKAFKVKTPEDLKAAERSTADYVLLDSGTGTGRSFDWGLLTDFRRPFFLAGGLDPGNVCDAIVRFAPCAVDVSSGIETDGAKDMTKAQAFMRGVAAADPKLREISGPLYRAGLPPHKL